ncbi:hypothetical protein M422DRAFT_249625 [Sphaerobolus stellatus SS14]|uniref:C2H2-type domain-containing protein n=1 Tax=Sphaerobolus stellatus (strain SS14) TaxID=990650 RepID=A0A0C9VHV5_SPHS4|nr:hypothetical protein M422DRAFT_249625 [Sphaerobolus stellatus SS14]
MTFPSEFDRHWNEETEGIEEINDDTLPELPFFTSSSSFECMFMKEDYVVATISPPQTVYSANDLRDEDIIERTPSHSPQDSVLDTPSGSNSSPSKSPQWLKEDSGAPALPCGHYSPSLPPLHQELFDQIQDVHHSMLSLYSPYSSYPISSSPPESTNAYIPPIPAQPEQWQATTSTVVLPKSKFKRKREPEEDEDLEYVVDDDEYCVVKPEKANEKRDTKKMRRSPSPRPRPQAQASSRRGSFKGDRSTCTGIIANRPSIHILAPKPTHHDTGMVGCMTSPNLTAYPSTGGPRQSLHPGPQGRPWATKTVCMVPPQREQDFNDDSDHVEESGGTRGGKKRQREDDLEWESQSSASLEDTSDSEYTPPSKLTASPSQAYPPKLRTNIRTPTSKGKADERGVGRWKGKSRSQHNKFDAEEYCEGSVGPSKGKGNARAYDHEDSLGGGKPQKKKGKGRARYDSDFDDEENWEESEERPVKRKRSSSSNSQAMPPQAGSSSRREAYYPKIPNDYHLSRPIRQSEVIIPSKKGKNSKGSKQFYEELQPADYDDTDSDEYRPGESDGEADSDGYKPVGHRQKPVQNKRPAYMGKTPKASRRPPKQHSLRGLPNADSSNAKPKTLQKQQKQINEYLNKYVKEIIKGRKGEKIQRFQCIFDKDKCSEKSLRRSDVRRHISKGPHSHEMPDWMKLKHICECETSFTRLDAAQRHARTAGHSLIGQEEEGED